MSPRPFDTSPEIWRMRLAILRRMTGEDRVRVGIELSESVREIEIAGMLARNPEWTRDDAISAILRRETGFELPGAP